jgi:hypothetical protein
LRPHARDARSQAPVAVAARIEVLHVLPEAETICSLDGTALKRIGEETYEHSSPAEVRVIRNMRPKYVCPCCRDGEPHNRRGKRSSVDRCCHDSRPEDGRLLINLRCADSNVEILNPAASAGGERQRGGRRRGRLTEGESRKNDEADMIAVLGWGSLRARNARAR